MNQVNASSDNGVQDSSFTSQANQHDIADMKDAGEFFPSPSIEGAKCKLDSKIV